MRSDTKLVHAGEKRPRVEGAAVLPIFRSTVFEHDDGSGYHDIRYPRLSNLPNHRVVADKLAALEGGEDALVLASGMAAVSTTLLTLAAGGGHILAQEGVYGGSHSLFVEDLAALGIDVTFINAADPDGWRSQLRDNTRVIYAEAISNPLVRVADHRAVVAFAREHGIVSVIDNTFATPLGLSPLRLGYDVVVHSATKYLNGHSDVVAGAVVGSRATVARIKQRADHLGGSLDVGACWLLHRGLKTLGLRVRRQSDSALVLARHLSRHDAVARAHYPGLEEHPDHARAKELLSLFGGVLSFEMKGGEAAAKHFLSRVTLFVHGPSLGGVESLVTRPAASSHAGLSLEARQAAGISEGLVRMSVGIEDPLDLIDDVDAALTDAPR